MGSVHRSRPVVMIVVGGLLATACSAGPSPAASPTPTAGARTISVQATDALRFEPATITVKAGEQIRFEVTNTGAVRHEFLIGDEAAQMAHETEMTEMGGMATDEPNGIFIEPGQTKTLEMSFPTAGSLLIGCHEPGHYAGGMKATLTVQP